MGKSIYSGSSPEIGCQGIPAVAKMNTMNFREKILSWEALKAWRDSLRKQGRPLVATNGCFDLLHLGHVTYLEAARNAGAALMVAVNSDASVRDLKGPNRPVNNEQDRAAVLAALASVDAVYIFRESDATRLLNEIRPDIYAKGGDYNIDTINQDERRLVESFGGRVLVLGGVAGKSTTGLLEKLGRQ